jgi:hypothetical protein
MQNQIQSEFSGTLIPERKAAEIFGCSPITLKISRTTGTLYGYPCPAFYKMGRTVRYDPAECRIWVLENCRKAANTSNK